MIEWQQDVAIYLHRQPVDFRKAINGLSTIVQDSMGLSPFERALFVFCNRQRSRLKVLYWDNTGFALWHKRLEKERFKWPSSMQDTVVQLSHQQWLWLLNGIDFTKIKPHQALFYRAVS
jgi:transposase